MNFYFIILSNILYFTHCYFFTKREGNLVYAIYGTWYHIHSHVTQPYVGLVDSTIYSFHV